MVIPFISVSSSDVIGSTEASLYTKVMPSVTVFTRREAMVGWGDNNRKVCNGEIYQLSSLKKKQSRNKIKNYVPMY